LCHAQVSYERAKGLTDAEERRLAEYRKHLQGTVEQLYELECTVGQVNRTMSEERRKAAEELDSLGMEKQNVQSHLFRVAEAQKRLQKEGFITTIGQAGGKRVAPTMTGGVHANAHVPIFLGGRPAINSLPGAIKPPTYGSVGPTAAGPVDKQVSFKSSSTDENTMPLNISGSSSSDPTSKDRLQQEIHKLKMQSSSILAAKQR
jgi:hypothetical protein